MFSSHLLGGTVTITSATRVSYTTPTGPGVDIFTCRASGDTSFLIRWRADDVIGTDNTPQMLSNSFEGVIISNLEEGLEEVSELRLSRDTVYRSPVCRVTGSLGSTVLTQEDTFEFAGMISSLQKLLMAS